MWGYRGPGEKLRHEFAFHGGSCRPEAAGSAGLMTTGSLIAAWTECWSFRAHKVRTTFGAHLEMNGLKGTSDFLLIFS